MSDCKSGAVEIITTVVFPGDPNSGTDATPISQAVMGAVAPAAAVATEAAAEEPAAEEPAAAPAAALDAELVAAGREGLQKM